MRILIIWYCFIAVTILPEKLAGQCPVGMVTVSSQQELEDLFQVQFPHCEDMYNGFLTLDGESIRSLTAMTSIRRLAGLTIKNTKLLKNLDGLENLRQLRELQLIANDSLQQIFALRNLEQEQELFLTVEANPSLQLLTGLNRVRRFGNVSIRRNAALRDLVGLNNMERVVELVIEENLSLKSVAHISDLVNIQRLFVIGNAQLEELSLPNRLNQEWADIGEPSYYDNTLVVSDNPSVTTIAFAGGFKVGRELEVSNNANLTSIEGVSVPSENDSIGVYKVNYNPRIKQLDIFDSLNTINTLSIIGNDSLMQITQPQMRFELKPFLTWSVPKFQDASILITDNPMLENLDFLEKLESANVLEISNNGSIETLSSLSDSLEIRDSVRVVNNANLETCNVPYICNLLATTPEKLELSGNKTTCQDKFTVEAECLSDIEEWKTNGEVSVYPNPSTGRVSVLVDKGSSPIGRIKVYDATGRVVSLSKPTELDLSGSKPGLYVLEIVRKDGEKTYEKVLITR